jgi:uncharacterized protein (DUF305 family)
MFKSPIFPLFIGLFILTACKTSEPIIHAHDEMVHQPQIERDFAELESLYWARIDRSRMNFTQADVNFMTDMIVHHAQAIIMSRLAPTNQASHTVQTLAARIINAQQDEIATMQKWLRDRGQVVPLVSFDGLIMVVEMEEPSKKIELHPKDHHQMAMDDGAGHHSGHTTTTVETHKTTGHESHQMHKADTADKTEHSMHADGSHENKPPMMGHDMSHHHDMPGMLTKEQLDHLATLRGSEFDKMFLTFMIEHHQGAVFMVNELFAADGAANDEESYRLAVDIYAEQVTEIEMMKLMLGEMPDRQPQPIHHQH